MLTDIADLYAASPVLFAGSVFVLGLVVGSFLNVVIYRLPVMLEREWRAQAAELTPAEIDSSSTSATTVVSTQDAPAPERFNLVVPRSACPHCNAPITAWQNIPVISWLALRGRCAACKAPISPRYPVVELATGILSAWAAWHFGFGAAAACAVVVTWALIALTGIDIDHQLLPDSITLPLLWGGLLASIAIGPVAGSALPVSPRDAIIGAAGGYLSLWLVFHAFRLVTGKEGMGYGDFKLFGALGAWMGWKVLPLIIVLSAATGAILGVAMIVLKGRDRAAPIPFGPYLAAAGWLAMLYGRELIDGYLRVSGLRH
ncbi:MAG TPA: A24 family peptidase [Steroidobacteraceae bacterium]|nr:A24 family peptidase [Steroidobacteraceae bacterium]